MRTIIAITQLSLDGVMQSPGAPEEDPSHGFKQGGWFMRFPDKHLQRTIHQLIGGRFALLLGRRTYDIFAGFWPRHDDNPIGKAFNRADKYVVTHQPKSLAWDRSQAIGGNVVAKLRRLKKTQGPVLHVWGSSELLQTLIAGDLIDEHRLWIAPVVLGKGKRLFEEGVPPRHLTLVKSLRTPSGLLLNTYRPGKKLKPPA